MRWFNWLALLVFPALLVSAEDPSELKIETTFSPEECTLQAESGDFIKVHYVCLFVLSLNASLNSKLTSLFRLANYSLMGTSSTRGEREGSASGVH